MTASRELAIDFNPDALHFFRQATPTTRFDASPVLAFLSTGFQITWFSEQRARVWLALVKPKTAVAQQFALNLEYLVVGHGFPEDFQQRTLLEEAPEEIGFRIDRRIRFVASSAPLMKAVCAAWAAEHHIAIVAIETAGLNPEANNLQDQLFALLSSSLWRRDIFDDSEPVTDASEFFGRERPVQEIVSRVYLGRPVALFGLRKIGKTSLLRRVHALLEANSTQLSSVAFLQCNGTKIKAGRWWFVVRELTDAWVHSLEKHAKRLNSSVRPGARKLKELFETGPHALTAAAVATAFEKDLEKLLGAARQLARESGAEGVRLVAILDEADELYPTTGSAGYWRNDYFDLWNTLQTARRGLDNPSELVYIPGGVNPMGVEAGAILDRPNPLFELGSRYLGPLPNEESAALLRGLGSRIGLEFDTSACEAAHRISGGHPWLLRKLGSKIHLSDPERSAARAVSADTVERVYNRTRKSFYAHVDWILNHLRTIAPDEYRLLRDIAIGGSDKYLGEWADFGFRDTFAEHLSQYGLLNFDGDTPEIRIPLVEEALTLPPSSGFDEQKRQLKGAIDDLEQAVRSRLARDISEGRTLGDAVKFIVEAIPGDTKNRPAGRDELRALGLAAGLDALMEGLNWSDYVSVIERGYECINWIGEPMARSERLNSLRATIEFAHVIRHNNDASLKERLVTVGFEPLFRQFRSAQEMFTT